MNDRPANFLPVVRRSIEDEIEGLIGLLDGMDTDADFEGTGDAEPWLGWPNGCQIATPDMSCDDDRELEDASGFGDADGMAVDMRGEPDLGWTEEIDQERRLQTMPGWMVEDGEPNLGRLETVEQGAGSYSGISDDDSQGNRLHFDGGGYSVGKEVLKRIGADGFVRTAPALPIAEFHEHVETLPDGTVMRSIVSKMTSAPDPDGDWRVQHYRAAHEDRAKTGENR